MDSLAHEHPRPGPANRSPGTSNCQAVSDLLWSEASSAQPEVEPECEEPPPGGNAVPSPWHANDLACKRSPVLA